MEIFHEPASWRRDDIPRTIFPRCIFIESQFENFPTRRPDDRLIDDDDDDTGFTRRTCTCSMLFSDYARRLHMHSSRERRGRRVRG